MYGGLDERRRSQRRRSAAVSRSCEGTRKYDARGIDERRDGVAADAGGAVKPRSLVAVAALGLLQACSPSVRLLTTRPPMHSGGLDSNRTTWEQMFGSDRWIVSEGVALAFECISGSNGPCSPFGVSSQNPAIASVHVAHWVDKRWGSPETVTSFVLVGVKPGETKVKVSSGNWDHEVAVVVQPASAPLANATPLKGSPRR